MKFKIRYINVVFFTVLLASVCIFSVFTIFADDSNTDTADVNTDDETAEITESDSETTYMDTEEAPGSESAEETAAESTGDIPSETLPDKIPEKVPQNAITNKNNSGIKEHIEELSGTNMIKVIIMILAVIIVVAVILLFMVVFQRDGDKTGSNRREKGK